MHRLNNRVWCVTVTDLAYRMQGRPSSVSIDASNTLVVIKNNNNIITNIITIFRPLKPPNCCWRRAWKPLVVKCHREVYHGLSKMVESGSLILIMTHADQKTTNGAIRGGGGTTVGVGNGGGGQMYRYDWESFLVDTSILVHDLQLGHDLRCEWYEQHLPSMLAESSLSSSSSSSLDGLTLAHGLALLDLR